MLKLNDACIQSIREQTDAAVSALREGKSARDVMTELYVSGLPDKADNQGRIMSDQIIQTVSRYAVDCRAALEDFEQWKHGWLDAQLKDKTLAERCQLLFRLNNAFQSVNAVSLGEHLRGEGQSADEIISALSGKKLDETAVSEELEAELMSQTLEAMDNCGLFLTQMDGMADLLDDAAQSGEFDRSVVNGGLSAADYKAIAAMIAYIAAKNGTLEEIPPETALEEITVGVCAAIDTQNVLTEVAAGSLAEDTARTIIRILGVVAAATITITFTFVAASLAAGILPGVLGIAAAFGVGIFVAVKLGRALFRAADRIAGWYATAVTAAAHAVVKVARRIAAWVRETVAPVLKNALRRAVDFTNRLITRGIAFVSGERTQTAHADA